MSATAQVEGGGAGGIRDDPAALEAAADDAASAGHAVGDVSEDLRDHGNTMTERWTGATADTASERVRLLSERSDIGREVLASLVTVVRDYAGELRAAQAAHAAAVAAPVAGRAALASARADVAALGVPASPASGWNSLLGGPSALAPGADPGAAIQAVAAQNRVADAQAALDDASSAIEAAFAAEARANADAARRVRTLVVELSSMTVATSFPPAHASDPTDRVAAGDPVPGTNPAWLAGQPEPLLGGHEVDVGGVGIGVLSGAWDDAAAVAALAWGASPTSGGR